ncbi:hypothetical protein SH611_14205 [Geminicoccaceae bacterium 1502E]|nr:hypothetical protein [Geminicoccaceae bacterium 1502E]
MLERTPAIKLLPRATAVVAAAVLAGCALGTAPPATAQDKGEDDAFTPIGGMRAEMPACPAELQAAVKECSISLTVTKDGRYQACFCDRYGVKPAPEPVIPAGERNLARGSSILLTKITEAGNPEDPCTVMKIDGQKHRVCW